MIRDLAVVACVVLAGCGADAQEGRAPDAEAPSPSPREEGRAAAGTSGSGAGDPAAREPRPAPRAEAGGAGLQELPPGVTPAMVARGEELFGGDGICYNCHGPAGGGIPRLGADLTDSAWVHVDGSYESLVRIIRDGVPSEASSFGMPMPPRGGARLSEDDVRSVAAYVWTLSR